MSRRRLLQVLRIALQLSAGNKNSSHNRGTGPSGLSRLSSSAGDIIAVTSPFAMSANPLWLSAHLNKAQRKPEASGESLARRLALQLPVVLALFALSAMLDGSSLL